MTDLPRRRRFRITLRALMVVVLVVGGLMAWKANRARSQRRAVAAIKAAKGSILYDYQYPGDDGREPWDPAPGEGPPGPRWLRRLLGDEYFQEGTMIYLPALPRAELIPSLATLDRLVSLVIYESRPDDRECGQIGRIPSLQAVKFTAAVQPTDADLAKLAGAPRLNRLYIADAFLLNDSGLASLASLPEFKSLMIMNAPKLTAQGLKNLGPVLASLESLTLEHTGLTDAGMDCLDGCRKLKTLSLIDAKIGDSGFSHFRNLDSLESLDVKGTRVTDAGLASLSDLKNLKSLALNGTKIEGPGLASLEALDKLETLELHETNIGDDALGSIRKLKGLKLVWLTGTKVTPGAAAALWDEMETLAVDYTPPSPTQ